MEVSPDTTLKEARDLFYRTHGFPNDGGITKDKWSPLGCRDLKVYLPNFEWRKKAIPFHDLHHIINQYAFSPTGEFQVAAWEFAAGKYPNMFTTVFCLPLVSMGAVLIPKRQFLAFLRGRRSRTLYCNHSYDEVLNRTVGSLRDEILPKEAYRADIGDYFEYTKLVAISAVVLSVPLIPVALILLGVS